MSPLTIIMLGNVALGCLVAIAQGSIAGGFIGLLVVGGIAFALHKEDEAQTKRNVDEAMRKYREEKNND